MGSGGNAERGFGGFKEEKPYSPGAGARFGGGNGGFGAGGNKITLTTSSVSIYNRLKWS